MGVGVENLASDNLSWVYGERGNSEKLCIDSYSLFLLAEAIAARTRASGRAQQLAFAISYLRRRQTEGLKAGIQVQTRATTTTVVLDATTV